MIMSRQCARPEAVEVFGCLRNSRENGWNRSREWKWIETEALVVARFILESTACGECPRAMNSRAKHAKEECVGCRYGNDSVVGCDGRIKE